MEPFNCLLKLKISEIRRQSFLGGQKLNSTP